MRLLARFLCVRVCVPVSICMGSFFSDLMSPGEKTNDRLARFMRVLATHSTSAARRFRKPNSSARILALSGGRSDMIARTEAACAGFETEKGSI